MPKSYKKEQSTEVDSNTDSDSSLTKPLSQRRKEKMSDKITLSVLTKFIKPYNGDRESLPAFLTNCENAISLASTDQQNVLIKYIVSQLEGKAQIACCLKKFESWIEIKQYLKSTFGEKKHSTHLLVDLQNCKQLPNEDVTQYSLRIESCLTRLQSDIHYSCENEKELIGRLAAMEDLALNTFLLGMNSDFSHIVRCRNPKGLSDAITHAIEEEKLFKLSRLSQRSSSSSSSKQCTICRKFGHRSYDCFKNKPKSSFTNSYHVNSNTDHRNNYSNNSNNITNKNNYIPNQICAYCKNRGHLIGDCRKLKYKNNNYMHRDPQRNVIPSSSRSPPSHSSNHKITDNSNIHVVSTENNNLN